MKSSGVPPLLEREYHKMNEAIERGYDDDPLGFSDAVAHFRRMGVIARSMGLPVPTGARLTFRVPADSRVA